MAALAQWLALVIPTFILVLARTMGLFIQAPLFSNQNVPRVVRMSLAVAISIVIMTLLPSYPPTPSSMLAFLILALTEFMLGALMGLATSFMFLAIQSAGELSGVQMGMSIASTINPFTRSTVNSIGTLYYNLSLVIFLLVGGHLYLIGGYFQSFKLVPIGTFVLTPELAEHFILVSGSFLAITAQLALPAVIVIALTDLGVGYINRVAQQASNIMDIIMGVKPLAGLFLILLLLPNVMSMTHILAEQMIRDLDKFMHIAGQR